MILKTTHKTYILAIILTAYTSFTFAQDQITLIDFGHSVEWPTTTGNWNNFTNQKDIGTEITLKDNTGASTGVIITLTDVFNLYQVSQYGITNATGINFG